jgi:ribosomal protein S18 acetylase RimI-like enzyme
MSCSAVLSWCIATADDLPAINRIAGEVHASLPERPEVFAEKQTLFPEGCFVLVEKRAVVGYGLCHPWTLNNIPDLDAFLSRVPQSPECLFIHDVAMLPHARRRGASRALLDRIVALAIQRGITFLALVSVYGTEPLWTRHGFTLECDDQQLRAKLASYGGTARYMIRRLG